MKPDAVPNDGRPCLGCGAPLRLDLAYVYVRIRAFREHLEPCAEFVCAFHAGCYDVERAPWMPKSPDLLEQEA